MESNKPQQEEQNLNSFQEKLLEQYSELVEEKHYEASQQAIQDRLAAYEAIGIKRAFKRVKKDTQSLLQERLNEMNDTQSKRILELRSKLPELEEESDDPSLVLPSLQEGLDEATNQYKELKTGRDNECLPSDLEDLV